MARCEIWRVRNGGWLRQRGDAVILLAFNVSRAHPVEPS